MDLGKTLRLLTELTAAETTKLLQQLKLLGLTFTHLLEAAVALAIAELDPIAEDEKDIAHITFENTVYAPKFQYSVFY